MYFISKVQKIRRIAIPKNIYEIMKIKEDDLLKVSVEVVKNGISKGK